MDGFVPVKSNFGVELWLGNNPGVEHIYTPELHPWSSLNQAVALAMNGEINYSHQASRRAWDFIRRHPGRFLALSLERVTDTWTAKYDVRLDPWLRLLHWEKGYMLFYSGLSLLALAGLLLAAYKYRSEAVPLVLTVLIFPVVYYVTHTGTRYRHPIDPVLCILSVFFVNYAWSLISLKVLHREETVTASLEPQPATTSRA